MTVPAPAASVDADTPLWTPDAAPGTPGVRRYMDWLAAERGLHFDDYEALWRWSVDRLEDFWATVWDYFDVPAATPYTQVLDARRMPGAKWFDGARLNIASQALRWHADQPDRPAIIGRSEARGEVVVTWGELRHQVAAAAAALRRLGIGPGDRVVAYLPNVPETAIAFLAVASLGAAWSSCSPDMGTPSVVDRFGQIAPKLLLAVDGYRYGGKAIDRRPVIAELRAALPSVQQVVSLPYLFPDSVPADTIAWPTLLAQDAPLQVEAVPFDQPLWVVYSSGTTGLPKPIVHGQGGVLLEYLKALGINQGLGPDDRYMWFTTTGWIMWNLQVGGLLLGATISLYDGHPGTPDLGLLWRIAAEQRLTVFGTGAAFLTNCMKAGLSLADCGDFSALRMLGSTGSPLPPEAFHWLYQQLGPRFLLASGSGGTDIASGFVGMCPLKPLYAGEMQARNLGVAVAAWDADGREVVDAVGELVVTLPMPSMPLYFWGDEGGRRYHDSYFDMYPGVWRHGDWLRITPRGGAIIYGRSDTTINRFGVRMGTSEIYRAVEGQPEVLDSLVVDLEYLGRESFMPLFVVLAPGAVLDDALVARINAAIRTACSPRHVPSTIVAAPEVPRTLSGKKMELPVKKLLLGLPVAEVASRDAMANPASLDFYIAYAAERRATTASEAA